MNTALTQATYYHAGPAGLTELLPLRTLIDDGIISIEQAQDAWYAKWGDYIEETALLAHPTLDEISLTTDLDEAKEIAAKIGGVIYVAVEPAIAGLNNEDCPYSTEPVRVMAL